MLNTYISGGILVPRLIFEPLLLGLALGLVEGVPFQGPEDEPAVPAHGGLVSLRQMPLPHLMFPQVLCGEESLSAAVAAKGLFARVNPRHMFVKLSRGRNKLASKCSALVLS